MFKLKNAALATAVILALAACGGGSDDPVVTEPAPGQTDGNNPGGGNQDGDTPGGDTGGGNEETPGEPTAPADAVFAGNMTLVADQVLVNGNQLPYSAFTGSGLYGQAVGANAPLSTIGVRVYQTAMNGQSDNVRVGFEMDDIDSDVRLQILINQATLSIADDGVMSIAVPATSSAFVTVTKSADSTATATATGLPADALRFTAIPDDPTSFGLTLDVDAIMAAAIAATPEDQRAALTGLNEVEGRFTVRLAFSGVDAVTTGGTDLALSSPLTVAGQPPLAGGYDADTSDAVPGNGFGVEGTLYVGILPPGVE